jgi:DNA-directed RNA polymerase subunit H (RpoH/RPB5)
MNSTKSTETGMAIVARQSPIKPRPTKQEILKATALAMHSEDCKRHGEAETAFKREKAKRIAELLLVAGKHLHLGATEVDKWYPKLEITFRLEKSHPPELNDALKGFHEWYKVAYDQLPKIRSVDDLLKELKEATCDKEQRIYSILQDEATRKSLIEEGTRLLGGGN